MLHFQNVPLAPVTGGGVTEGSASIFMHVAVGSAWFQGQHRGMPMPEITKGQMIQHQKLPQRGIINFI